MSLSTSTAASVPSISFFGATGGCVSSCLVHTLQAGYTVSALARTPSKLRAQLLSQGIAESTLTTNLVITQGSATDATAIKDTLTARRGDGSPTPIIVSGIGGTPTFQWSLITPVTLTDPKICQNSASVLVQALRDLEYSVQQKPLLAFVSTTGISQPRGPEDVPFLYRFLYHYMLKVPHVDKRVAEEILRGETRESGVFRSVVGVRPTLLAGGVDVNDARGLEKVRVGTERNPAVGYTIKRADVGEWISRECVEKRGAGYGTEMVSLTY